MTSNMKPDQCQLCGAVGSVTEVTDKESYIPHRLSKNRIFRCPSCHLALDRSMLRSFEFEAALADLMQASGKYRDIRTNALFVTDRQQIEVDIVANSANDKEMLVIECKAAPTIGTERVREAIAQLKTYGVIADSPRLIVALAARLSVEQRMIATQEGIEIWGLDEIASKFRNEIDRVGHPFLRAWLSAAAALRIDTETHEHLLMRELRSLEPGRDSWSSYQKLVSRIFERLFCPPLSAPIVNLGDGADANRRDIILPNYAEEGFWGFVRNRYAADFIVVDAKNYSEQVGKSEALQVLNYLKPHGSGHLGLIVTRKGADNACMTVIREQWTLAGKLIVVLSDEHIERMLRAKEACGPPEDVIRQLIEEFRLSM